MKIVLVFCVVLLGLISCTEQEEVVDTLEDNEERLIPGIDSSFYYDSINMPHIKRVHAYFDTKIANKQLNGVYLFAQNGYVLDSGCYGIKDISIKDSLNFNTRFQLASGSKPFTAIAILQLIEAGKLNLNDSAHHILKELPYKGITVDMLLCHRAGLGKYTSFTEYLMKDSIGHLTNQGILDILQDTIPAIYYPPNKKHDYSNTGYALLASIVERISGQTFKAYMHDHIFEPCGMTNSFIYDYSKELPSNTAVGYVGRNFRNPGNAYLDGVVGDKGMYATMNDLLLFDQALYDGFISDSLLSLAMAAHNPIKTDGSTYGYGWRIIHPNTDSTIVYHTGWWHGSRSFFIRYPKEKKTIIVLDNVKTGSRMGIKELLGLVTDDY